MEQAILSGNPLLKNILEKSVKCEALPITISQISFDRKSQVENHVLLLGDAAGMIAPLCGNGMSMALHGSKLAAIQIDFFLNGDISRKEMETSFVRQWRNQFSGRLQRGRVIQRLLGNRVLTNFFIHLGRHFPALIKWMIRQTHGKSF
jgi:flavin-dependent dehydrogenase